MSNVVCEAYQRIRGLAHRTPVVTSATLDRESGNRVFLKCENFQRAGAFKFRGACNAIVQLTPDERRRGVVTHSSGNHAQALALAASLNGVACRVVMPTNAPEIKRRATAGYGAEIIPCEPTLAARESTAARVVAETGAILIPPYDDDRIIAGAGTAALELLEDVPDLDAILTPVGGGGLVSGTALAAQTVAQKPSRNGHPACEESWARRPCYPRVIGCEPAGADDAYRSLKSGERITNATPRTIADGLRTTLGVRNFDIIRRHVADIALVTEEEIIEAMRFIWERVKIIIEPSSAVAVAPVLFRKLNLAGQKIGIILSGGNVDVSEFFGLLRAKI
ncbi:threonine/serine dehydratase [Candidatus Sumerlaeota bacterium]|nr:threonine/serine dehydratase [Candidatus Sumerlaeota bacterium]